MRRIRSGKHRDICTSSCRPPVSGRDARAAVNRLRPPPSTPTSRIREGSGSLQTARTELRGCGLELKSAGSFAVTTAAVLKQCKQASRIRQHRESLPPVCCLSKHIHWPHKSDRFRSQGLRPGRGGWACSPFNLRSNYLPKKEIYNLQFTIWLNIG